LKYLPSKKLIIVFAFLLVLAGGFWFFSGQNQKGQTYKKSSLEVSMSKIANNANTLDYDNDGLKDWEETLWKTDIENPDTDGDGTPDGEEVKLGRNPTQAGPGDKLPSAEDNFSGTRLAYPPSVGVNPSDPVNLTQEISESFSSQIMSQKEKGKKLEDLGSLDFVSSEGNQNLAKFVATFYPQIPMTELNITEETGLESDQRYVDGVKEILSRYTYPETPEDVFVTPLQTKDFTAVDIYIDSLKKTVVDLKKMPVPSEFSQIHRQMTESLVGIQKTYESIKEIEEDPIKTLIGLNQNEKITEKMQKLITDFLSLAQAKGVQF